jgi:hypothetical protein
MRISWPRRHRDAPSCRCRRRSGTQAEQPRHDGDADAFRIELAKDRTGVLDHKQRLNEALDDRILGETGVGQADLARMRISFGLLEAFCHQASGEMEMEDVIGAAEMARSFSPGPLACSMPGRTPPS